MRINSLFVCLSLFTIIGASPGLRAAAPKFAPPLPLGGEGETITNVLANYDFDGDGHKDIVLGDYVTGALTVMLNVDGTGTTFGNSATIDFGFRGVNWVAAGNLSHSGTVAGSLPDLAIADGGEIIVEANAGLVSGTLTFNQFATMSDPNYFFDHIAVVDLDGDGYDDIVASAQPFDGGDAQLAVFMNLGANGPGFADPVYYDAGLPEVDNIAAGDLNGDGNPDVVVTGPDSSTEITAVLVFMNAGDGEGTMDPATVYHAPEGANITSVQIGNLAGHMDGRQDIFATGTQYFRTLTAAYSQVTGMVALVNRGDDTFFLTESIPVGAPVTVASVGQTFGSAAIFASNPGGAASVAVADPPGGSITLIGFTAGKDAQGMFTSLTPSLSLTHKIVATTQVAQVAVADLNGDGKPDLVGAVHLPPSGPIITSSTSAVVLLKRGAGGPAPLLTVSATSSVVTGTADLGDDIEYVVSYANTGNGTATGVMLGSTIPSAATYAPGSATGVVAPVTLRGTVRALEWTLGNLPPETSGSQTFHVTVDATLAVGGKLKGSVGIKGDDSLAAGKLPTIVVETPLALLPVPTAMPASNPTGDTTVPGDTITYTINYENRSGIPIQDVLLTSTVPGKTFEPTLPKETKVSWDLGVLLPHSSGSKTLVVQVSAKAKNNAAVTGMARLSAPHLSVEAKTSRVIANLPPLTVVVQ